MISDVGRRRVAIAAAPSSPAVAAGACDARPVAVRPPDARYESSPPAQQLSERRCVFLAPRLVDERHEMPADTRCTHNKAIAVACWRAEGLRAAPRPGEPVSAAEGCVDVAVARRRHKLLSSARRPPSGELPRPPAAPRARTGFGGRCDARPRPSCPTPSTAPEPGAQRPPRATRPRPRRGRASSERAAAVAVAGRGPDGARAHGRAETRHTPLLLGTDCK